MHNPLSNWIDCDLPSEYDIALLRPATLPRGKRFETEDDVYETADNHIVPKLRDRLSSIAQKIEHCGLGVELKKNCLLPICPICARQYRRFFISEVLRIYREKPNEAQTVTVYLGKYEVEMLANASLGTVHNRFRNQLRRSGFGGAVIIGGTEVTYRPELNDWLLHLHALSLGASEKAWENLEKLKSKDGIRNPVRRKPVQDQDHIEQLSYIQKFHTYYRAGTPHGKNRSRTFPLKPNQLCELASWACKHNFPDFTFCFGVKRRNGHFYLEAPKTKKPATLPRGKLILERDSARRAADS
jgi:hypothetical protein